MLNWFTRNKNMNSIQKYLFYLKIGKNEYKDSLSEYSLFHRIEIFKYVYNKSTDKAALLFDRIFKKEIIVDNPHIPSHFFKLAFSLKLDIPEITSSILENDFPEKNLIDLFYILEVYKSDNFKIIDKLPNKQSLYQYIEKYYHSFNETLLTLNYSNKLFDTKTEIESSDSVYENNIYSVIYKYYKNSKEIHFSYENIIKRYSPEDSFIGLVYINLLKHTYNSLGGNLFLPTRNRESFKDIILNCQQIINNIFGSEVINDDYLRNIFLDSITRQFFAHKLFVPYKTSHDGVILNVHNNVNQHVLYDYLSLFKTLKKEVDFINFNAYSNQKESVANFLIKVFLIQYKINHNKNNQLYQYKRNHDAKTEILSLLKNVEYSESINLFLKEHINFIPSDFFELRSAIEYFSITHSVLEKNNDLLSKRKRL